MDQNKVIINEKHKLPSQEYLNSIFEYDAITGELKWKFRLEGTKAWNTRYANQLALNSVHRKGYLYGSLGRLTVRTHRVIWKLLYDTEPVQIDHINGIRSDNRQINLRGATAEDNQKNTKLRTDNKSGCVGVQFRKDIEKWRAYINVNKKQVNLGTFDTKNDAIKARKTADLKYEYHKNHGRIADIIYNN